jgi:hypothetical protein
VTGEEYLAALQAVVAAHPGVQVKAYDHGDDYREPTSYEACPEWSAYDQVIYADCEPV